MAKTIKNDNIISINRTTINEDLTTTVEKTNLGRYYFEASRELKSVTLQMFFDTPPINDDEKAQLAEIYKTEYLQFATDASAYGWSILDITKEATTEPTTI